MQARAPEVPIARACEDPFLSRPFAETRALGLGSDYVLNGLADKAGAASNEDHVGHGG